MIKGILETFRSMLSFEESSAEGFFQSLDGRAKLCGFAVFIITAVFIQTLIPLLILLASVLILVLISTVPFKLFLLRVSMFIPLFAAVIVSPMPFTIGETVLAQFWLGPLLVKIFTEGILKALIFILRIWICVSALNLLILTTKFSAVLFALRRLYAPSLLVMMMAITYRFIFLFVEEAHHTILAREARTTTRMSRLSTIKDLGRIVGSLFIRAYENGEKVYLAMIARGYDGEPRMLNDMRFTVQSGLFICIISITSASALVIQYIPLR